MLNAIVDIFDKNVRIILDKQIKDKNITENKKNKTQSILFKDKI
jgi:hypothetical protein